MAVTLAVSGFVFMREAKVNAMLLNPAPVLAAWPETRTEQAAATSSGRT